MKIVNLPYSQYITFSDVWGIDVCYAEPPSLVIRGVDKNHIVYIESMDRCGFTVEGIDFGGNMVSGTFNIDYLSPICLQEGWTNNYERK